MKKNKMKFVMTLAICLFVITACGEKESLAKDNKEDVVTIRMSWWGNDERHTATLDAIEKFEKKHSNIKVKAEYSGFDGVEQKIATQMTGNTEPDLMQMNSGWLDLYSPDGDGYYDLSKLENLDLSGYDKDVLAQAQVNGIQNAVPFAVNTWVWAVNKTTFNKLNLEIPTTWDGYVEIAEKFEEGTYPTQLSSADLQIYLQQKTGKSFVSENGEVNYSKEDLVEGLEWYNRMVKSNVTPGLPELKEAAVAAGSGVPSKKFLTGEYGGTTQWAATVGNDYLNLKDVNQELVLSNYPTIDEKSEAYVSQSIMPFGVSKNTKHPEEVAELLNFLINDPEGIKAMGVTRGLPANKKAYEILKENNQIDEMSQQIVEYTNRMHIMPKNKYLKMSRIQTAFDDNFESFAFGKTDSEETAEKMLKEMKDSISQFNSTR